MALDQDPGSQWTDFTAALGAALQEMPAYNDGSKLTLNEKPPESLFVGFIKDQDGLTAEIGPVPSRGAPARLAALLSPRGRALRRQWAEFGSRLTAAGWTPPQAKERWSWTQELPEPADRADYERLAAAVTRVLADELHLVPSALTYTAFQEDPLRDLQFDGLGTQRPTGFKHRGTA
ncbi:hypothetical protein C3486_26105 [Streptomyces sp. Ru73]|uniref:TY-Chap domain-containing protein n=1 Tax=Streptomyces sp. Ru73 TaxID=2080748 RepID=UPI000CDCE2F3|nr:hypothetical protein [Streptomyces sp. Ru73]POX37895.1 hypothetical protein C3486_26105 [Streptomyces sp. Ru73]